MDMDMDTKIYGVTPFSLSITTPRDGTPITLNELIDEFKDSNKLPDLDPTEAPDENHDVRLLNIKIDIAGKDEVSPERFYNVIHNNKEWMSHWKSESYFNKLSAYNGADQVAELYLMPDSKESTEGAKVLYWQVKVLRGTSRELNELVYRLNKADILGPIYVRV